MGLFGLQQDLVEKFSVHTTGTEGFVFVRDFETLFILKHFVESTTLVHNSRNVHLDKHLETKKSIYLCINNLKSNSSL